MAGRSTFCQNQLAHLYVSLMLLMSICRHLALDKEAMALCPLANMPRMLVWVRVASTMMVMVVSTETPLMVSRHETPMMVSRSACGAGK